MVYRGGDEPVKTLTREMDFFAYIPALCRLSVRAKSQGGGSRGYSWVDAEP